MTLGSEGLDGFRLYVITLELLYFCPYIVPTP